MLTSLLFIWVALLAVLMSLGARRGQFGSGMPLAYFLGLSLIHTPGAAVYLNTPDWDVLSKQTELGFEETIIGMTVFVLGVCIARGVSPIATSALHVEQNDSRYLAALDKLGLVYLALGVFYLIFGSLISIASLGAILTQISSLVIVGACLRLWVAREQNNRVKFWLTVTFLPLLPMITLLKGGFLGGGIIWLFTIMSFSLAQSKRRLGYFVIAPFFVFLGLSVFVNYMASRNEFRKMLWYHEVGLSDRVQLATNMFSNFQWYNSENPKHRSVIDARLNQNIIVGAAVGRLQAGTVDYAHGSTLLVAAMGLVPRALWRDKPQVGGGGTIVRDYAGVDSPEGTSVGAGQVLEFYINFGVLGVVGGFLIYGFLIGWMDLRIIESLRLGDQRGFLFWFIVCLSLQQPGGNLLEIVVTVAASIIMAKVFGRLLKGRFPLSGNPQIPAVSTLAQWRALNSP